jgi:hypothetical protein
MAKNKHIISIALHPILYKYLKLDSERYGIAMNKFVNWAVAYWLSQLLSEPVPFPAKVLRHTTIHTMIKKYFLSKNNE